MTRDEWEEIAKHLKAAFPKNKDFLESHDTAMIWYNLVMDWTFKDCKNAVWMCIRGAKFPPTIADLQTAYEYVSSVKNTRNNQLREIYKDMENYYPVVLRDKDRLQTFSKAIQSDKDTEMIEKAREIHNAVIGRVKEAEKGNIDDLPILSECIRSLADNGYRKDKQ